MIPRTHFEHFFFDLFSLQATSTVGLKSAISVKEATKLAKNHGQFLLTLVKDCIKVLSDVKRQAGNNERKVD
jgi:hypothetical protein